MITRKINTLLAENYSDDVPQFLRPIYAARNIYEQDLDLSLSRLLVPDFADLPHALSLLTNALRLQHKIIIVADFDADGATSCALMITALRGFGLENVDFIVPNRFTDGYGLSPLIAEKAYEKDADMIITVDNGISSIAGCARAKELGMQIIITDHHLPGESLPDADAIINPNLKDCTFASKNLAGVGVAFYLCSALKSYLEAQHYFTLNSLPIFDMRSVLDLVALGTVADVVPLDRNNKILVNAGLVRIRNRQCAPGILALLSIAKKSYSTLKSTDLGFSIAPRINASGRMDDMTRGIRCLLSIDNNDAYRYALELDEFNTLRKQTQEQMSVDADALLKGENLTHKFSICLYNPSWHEGVIGIVAGKCKEKYNAVSIIFARSGKHLKGSARSINGVHIKDLLDLIDRKYPHIIISFGGHAMAAGLNIYEEYFEEFAQVLEQETKIYLHNQLPSSELLTDGELAVEHITLENALLLESHIWGSGCEEPVFYNDFIIKEQRVIGEKHLRLRLELAGKVFAAVAFFTDEIASTHIRMAYHLSVNYYKQAELQLISKEITLL